MIYFDKQITKITQPLLLYFIKMPHKSFEKVALKHENLGYKAFR